MMCRAGAAAEPGIGGARCAGAGSRILLLEVEFLVEEEAEILVEQAAADGEVRYDQCRLETGREARDF
jgi:hypothetical protein